MAMTSMYVLMPSSPLLLIKQRTVNMKVGVKVCALLIEALLLFMCGSLVTLMNEKMSFAIVYS